MRDFERLNEVTSDDVISVSSTGIEGVRVSDEDDDGKGGNRGCEMSSDKRDARRERTNTFCSVMIEYNACAYVDDDNNNL